MRQIGNAEREVIEPLIDAAQTFFRLLDPIAQRFHGGNGGIRGLLLTFQARNVIRAFLELMSEVLDGRHKAAPILEQFAQVFPRNVLPAGAKLVTYRIEILSQRSKVVHRGFAAKRGLNLASQV